MVFSIDPIVYFFIAIFLYYFFLFILSHKDPKHRATSVSEWGFVIFIPVHNEEKVIASTIRQALDLPVKPHIIVVDDGSTDNTHQILQSYKDKKFHIVKRSYPNAKKGKGEALNSAYNFFCANYKRWFPRISFERIIITVLDADGYLDTHIFEYIVGMYEKHEELGGIQIPVTIQRPDTSMLLRMQDLEFVGFSFFVQQARHWFSSLGLGGNGQFIRYSAIKQLGKHPWNGALSEDLDIGIRLLLRGIQLGYCNSGFVHQQGLTRLKPLLKQRTRWIQGHYQAWSYLPAIWQSRLSFFTKLDLTFYLLLVASVLVVLVNNLLNIVVMMGLVHIKSDFYDALTAISPSLTRMVIFFVSFGTTIFFAFTYKKFSRNKIPWTSWPTIIVVFSMYGWIWIYASVAAILRIMRKQNGWVKTERVRLSVDYKI